MVFPYTRQRRLREHPALRRLVIETHLHPHDLVMPYFVIPGRKKRQPIPSLAGQYRFSQDELLKELDGLVASGVQAVLLFGLPAQKNATGSGAYAKNGVVQRAVRAIKKTFPDLAVITDVCLCAYTDHGHCGVLSSGPQPCVDNDKTLPLLAKTALSHADAGADMVAPSDMMDGRVGAIRKALDRAGHTMTPVMSYAVKYASAFYGPFRDAAKSAPSFGDRFGYQMSPPNAREALREAACDIEEGADIVMVKPAMAYLDIIRMLHDNFDVPVAAYHVSGELAMVEAAAEKGYLDRRRAIMETLTSIKRAGADIILTYWAREVATWIQDP